MEFKFQAIGFIESCYKEKFGVPRQPGLAPAARGKLKLVAPFNLPDVARGLESSSHIWIQFVFHQCLRQSWKPVVRPPRLGGNEKIGVFATRSTFRPNPIGLSVVRLEQVETNDQEVILHLSGLDLIEGTPVLDIKPYIPYVDQVADAENVLAAESPDILPVYWSVQAQKDLQRYQQQFNNAENRDYQALVEQVLQQDPRPAYRKNRSEEKVYGIRLGEADVRFTVSTALIGDPNETASLEICVQALAF
ncbi:tRNA (N6-threonylcarbamoyladenosine(37)-N6)-methyltransferase TrmO [Oceanospirillum sediminis]|uniref:tRNA (N6-threonylcarbamoyladenosine(37)-N6)-methyltransferase TrmO n=1 Tax=Oceanospirillum sediminis TaxID=2760088 RepID=A0A839IU03_9GAMM|nr:tRNA (N6-threonylcarbamoyladenosine(37)-N6)-methyltransferase TrmO [Oceanospirillum sediminis]MBB1488428.1 tRNA (N6-threonylcarbamoyladenosine(37)-N6)-methyltransferase TrmO [Oceanospirillum sediminis]